LHTVCQDSKGFVRYRFPEIDSLCVMVGAPVPCYNPACASDEDSAFVEIIVDNEQQGRDIVGRAVLIRALYEIWGSGTTHEELLQSTLEYSKSPSAERYLASDQTFSIKVDGFGVSFTKAEQKDIRDKFGIIPFKGQVQLAMPQNKFKVFVECGVSHAKDKATPKKLYFARRMMKSPRKQLEKYNLKKRLYLGPTSTCAELAFLMANQALLKAGDVVYDPFVGTGSLAVACAHFNAYTIGSDIDWRVLHGQTRAAKSDIFGNFKHYGLPRPELICSDQTHPVWRIAVCQEEEEKNPDMMRFDAIVCDPPYGVRAGARKSGTTKREAKPILPEHMGDHVPATQVYDVEDVMIDLLDFSAATLKMHGRLVYLLPTTPDFTRETLPAHPCLEIHSVSEQILRANFSRLLVTMVKTRAFSNELKAVRRNRAEEVKPSFGNMKEILLAPPKDPQQQRLRNRDKGLCKYFKAGKCTMGERCKWSHTSVEGQQ